MAVKEGFVIYWTAFRTLNHSDVDIGLRRPVIHELLMLAKVQKRLIAFRINTDEKNDSWEKD